MKVFAETLGCEQRKFMNFFLKMWFPWKPVDVHLGTISENMLVLATAINVRNFMLVSESAQFA